MELSIELKTEAIKPFMGQTRRKLYRGRYLIGVYAPVEEGETLMALCQNTYEFADLLGINVANATRILQYLFVGKTSGIRFCGRLCAVAFILDEEE